MTLYSSTPYSELSVGMEAEIRRLCRAEDFFVFANASGNHNPMHLPREDHDGDGTPDEPVAPSMWVASLFSAVFGNMLPGPGTLYKGQTLRFLDRARAGEELTVKVRLTELKPDRVACFETWIEAEDGRRIVEGVAEVIAPERSVTFDDEDLPGLTVRRHVHFDRLLDLAEPLDPIPTAVVCPEEENALAGALLAAEHTLIRPILIGDSGKIAEVAAQIGADLTGFELLDEPDHDQAAATGVRLIHEGRANALMKGHLHTSRLLRHIVKRDGGLRTGKRLSHVFVMDVPGLDHLLMVTDAAINITPTLEEKVDITQNAIDLGLSLGIEQPKVGILSAIETVNPKIPSTIDAAVLSKMAERGQIKGGLVDGPLAMDNAVDIEAAKTKGIRSLVAGHADILVVPNMEAGNMLAKELTFVAHAEAAGIVMGALCPIILNSRADDDKARLASCAVAALYHEWRKRP
ncbi:bifunctional enoyl-CoA hydratase/phosphate acetyltransferase [Oricola thermophila]|uniref:Bifunctional enoyl-CoA hydratase/phosphate acetyltransferase n=1 Tax=Oricola thermophila TaxID=2742145 RepID=A0A6N1VD77_9HYPH|nr:bifunctional enoyl-CoA hydratase/phosphate acetyltransferase [Oricola thermophila]QKV17545.1 bifunctional enoyl-CoA hydratase/phosphate acetyltransferase [Oricola thermophila]